MGELEGGGLEGYGQGGVKQSFSIVAFSSGVETERLPSDREDGILIVLLERLWQVLQKYFELLL